METLPLPLSGNVYRGVDGIELSDESYVIYDGYPTPTKGIKRRPGLEELLDFGTIAEVNGMYFEPTNDNLFVAVNGKLYKVNRTAGVYGSTDLTSTALNTANRAYFAYDGTNIYVCNGGRILYSNGSSTTAAIADADAPTSTRKIIWLDGYLIAITGSDNKFYFSDVNDASTWSALDFASAAGNPDRIVSIGLLNREIFLFGSRTTEVWENDGVSPFARTSGGFIETGCSAPHAIFTIENEIFWFNQDKQLCRSGGSGVKVEKGRYDTRLSSLSDFDNAYGYRVDADGHTFLVTHFPSDGATIVYDVSMDEWVEWGKWNSALGDYERFLGCASAPVPEWNKVVLGGRDGKLYGFSTDTYDDNGDEIRLCKRLGHVDHGSSIRKRCEALRVRARRGTAVSTEPHIMVRWKNNNQNVWGNEHLLSLGNTGETDLVLRMRNLGIYQTRQWEFSCTDAVPVVLSRAEVDVEFLG